ncbi:MAG TPA: DUF4276 family protein [Gemmatimonadales bacterium]|nr:DUF4276 family protein [Gemmatimonadales bacterium]
MAIDLACIVEGHGEVEAIPVTIRRIANLVAPKLALKIHPPFRVPRKRLVKPDELERSVELAARRAGINGAILIVLDGDDDCPAAVGPELLARAQKARSDIPIRVVLAKREFEAWFLASAKSLRGRRGLARDLEAPSDPEAIRGAKEWLTARMGTRQRYVETLDQPALAAVFDLESARKGSPSFDKLVRDIVDLAHEFGE